MGRLCPVRVTILLRRADSNARGANVLLGRGWRHKSLFGKLQTVEREIGPVLKSSIFAGQVKFLLPCLPVYHFIPGENLQQRTCWVFPGGGALCSVDF